MEARCLQGEIAPVTGIKGMYLPEWSKRPRYTQYQQMLTSYQEMPDYAGWLYVKGTHLSNGKNMQDVYMYNFLKQSFVTIQPNAGIFYQAECYIFLSSFPIFFHSFS